MEYVRTNTQPAIPRNVILPAPTAWPFVTGARSFADFRRHVDQCVGQLLGAILFLVGAVGWFRQVLPHEHHVEVPVTAAEPGSRRSPRLRSMRLPAAQQVQRAWLPLKIYPISAGVKGGLRAVSPWHLLAMLYGLIFYRSIWYPINLIAGSLYASPAMPTTDALMHFRLDWFLFALAMHITMCLLVGLLYGAMLPMLPTRPIVLGGIVGPLLWTGLALPHSRFRESVAGSEDQLALVRSLAGCIRSRGRAGGGAPEQGVGPRRTCPSPCAPASKRRASCMSATTRTISDDAAPGAAAHGSIAAIFQASRLVPT